MDMETVVISIPRAMYEAIKKHISKNGTYDDVNEFIRSAVRSQLV